MTANAISGHRRRQEAEAAAADQAAYEQQQQVAQLQQQVAQPPAPPTAAAGLDLTGELGKLAALRDGGALSEEEFAAAKAKLLG